MTSRELLKRSAFAKRHPEWEDDLKGANIAIAHAGRMVEAGKLTHKEFKEYEAHLWQQMLEAMPVEVFSEMMTDGSIKDLEALASYDDDRDSHDVTEGRKAIERKVKADALELKWLDGTIDSKTYAQLSRDHVGKSERLDDMIADGDHEGAAVEAFGEAFEDRYGNAPDQDNELVRYLNEKYGGGTKPDGSKVEPFSLKRDDRSSWEKATDKNGVTDIDKAEEYERGGSDYSTDDPPGYVDHDENAE